MAKRKKKKKEGFDMDSYMEGQLERMKKGEFHFDAQGKHRYKKYRFPKWLDKHDGHGKSSHVRVRKLKGRWANNEERIIMEMFVRHEHNLKELAKKSKIDYKNISRYLQALEKKNLVEIDTEYSFKRMPSGKLKTHHPKRIKLTKKGTELKKELLGF